MEGELLDGRKGLVPTNFIEKLSGEDLLEFHRCAVLANDPTQEEYSTAVPVNLPIEYPISPEKPAAPICKGLKSTKKFDGFTSFVFQTKRRAIC